jgi:hypothetical protein
MLAFIEERMKAYHFGLSSGDIAWEGYLDKQDTDAREDAVTLIGCM